MLFWWAITAPAFAQCGVERWAIKTLADPEAAKALAAPLQITTIAELSALPAIPQATLERQTTRLPEEFRHVNLAVLVLGFKQETDSDFHIVLGEWVHAAGDPGPPKLVTMIGEIPAPICVPEAYRDHFAQLRAQFIRLVGSVSPHYKRLANPLVVSVEGIVFRDFCHGQTGRAPNCVQIHPVWKIEPLAWKIESPPEVLHGR